MKKVVLDTDYFRFITMDLTNESVFEEVMKQLEYKPVVHEFIYKQELHEHSFVKKLVANGVIEVLNFDDICKDDKDLREYERLFKFAYYEMNGRKFNSTTNVIDFHHSEENLGEIHSLILAKQLGYDILMSNDGGAKSFVDNKLNSKRTHISVINIEDTFTTLVNKDNSKIKWKDLKPIINQYKKNNNKTDDAKYDRIRKLWANE